MGEIDTQTISSAFEAKFGIAYRKMVEKLIEPNVDINEVRQLLVEEEAGEFLRNSFEVLLGNLEYQVKLLESYRGNEVEFILQERVFKRNKTGRKNLRKFINAKDLWKYYEPIPGLPVILLDPKLEGLIPRGNEFRGRCYIRSLYNQTVAFIMVFARMDVEKDYSAHGILKHEMSHFFWNLGMQKNQEFLYPSKRVPNTHIEKIWSLRSRSPKVRADRTWNSFRDEYIAYTLGGREPLTVDPLYLGYNRSKKIRRKLTNCCVLALVATFLCRVNKVEGAAIFSAILESESVEDFHFQLMNRLKKIDFDPEKVMQHFYTYWAYLLRKHKKYVLYLLAKVGVTFSVDAMEEYGKSKIIRMEKAYQYSLWWAMFEADSYKGTMAEFGRRVDTTKTVAKLIREAMGYSEALTEKIMQSSEFVRTNHITCISVHPNLEKAVKSWFSIQHMHIPEYMKWLQEILIVPEIAPIWKRIQIETCREIIDEVGSKEQTEKLTTNMAIFHSTFCELSEDLPFYFSYIDPGYIFC